MARIIYGTITGSIEAYGQCVLMDVPDDADADDVEEYLRDHRWTDVPQQPVVGFYDVVDALRLIIPAVGGIHPSNAQRVADGIIAALLDAFGSSG